MGVVRSEGDWKLNKRETGLYEVTHRGRTEAKIITDDYSPGGLATNPQLDMTVPVHEVHSFTDAESVFYDYASKSKETDTLGLGQPTGGGGPDFGLDQPDTDMDLRDVPPIGYLILGLIMGGVILPQRSFDTGDPVFLVGAAFSLIAIGVVLFTIREYQQEGLSAAVDFLMSTGESDQSSSKTTDSNQEKTPPAPKSLRYDLIFERADQHCEWCNTFADNPQVHHIEPRSEGGPNEPGNLIVLCHNCHDKADREAISRSKLEAKVSRQMDSWSK